MFRNLQAKFDGRAELPIEIQDICDALVELGYQDDIRVVAEAMDMTQLCGTYVQWREHNGPYGDPKWVSLIVYPSNTDHAVQRIICAKELVHVCDSAATKTHDADEVIELARALCDKIAPGEKLQIAKLKVAKDVLAQGQAMMLLFPKAARLIARQKIADGRLTVDDLVNIVAIPRDCIEEMLDPDWDVVAEHLCDF